MIPQARRLTYLPEKADFQERVLEYLHRDYPKILAEIAIGIKYSSTKHSCSVVVDKLRSQGVSCDKPVRAVSDLYRAVLAKKCPRNGFGRQQLASDVFYVGGVNDGKCHGKGLLINGTEKLFDGTANPAGAEGLARFPDSSLESVIEAAEECPGECIFIDVGE